MPIFRGAIFDVDGVLINSPHEEAWRQSLQELMGSDWADIRDRTTWSPAAFTSHVYQEEVSGEPRINGARAALGYFHVPDADRRAEEYAQRKQATLERLIQSGDFGVFPDALRFVIALKDLGFRIAAASSSKNADTFLRKSAWTHLPRSKASSRRRSGRGSPCWTCSTTMSRAGISPTASRTPTCSSPPPTSSASHRRTP